MAEDKNNIPDEEETDSFNYNRGELLYQTTMELAVLSAKVDLIFSMVEDLYATVQDKDRRNLKERNDNYIRDQQVENLKRLLGNALKDKKARERLIDTLDTLGHQTD
ncbi:MAG: hypothetical protein R3211_06335 [Balneolaceae bacterium]|nr:hypothetical protein [Balneolaceae bacterium]